MNRYGLKFNGTARHIVTGIFFVWVLIGSSLGSASDGGQGRVVIDLLPEVEVDGTQIHLAQIARIHGGPPGMSEKLASVLVGNTPPPGSSRRIGANYIDLRLKQHHIDPALFEMAGAAKVTVHRGCVDVGEKKLRSLVSEFVQSLKFGDQTTVVIKDIHVPQKITLPKGRITYRLTVPDNFRPSGSIPLFLHFFVDGVEYKKERITVRVELIKEVVVAKRPIGRYKPIQQEDIQTRKMNIANLSSNIVTDSDAVLGQRAKRHIYPNTVLRSDMIEFPPIIKRGDLVLIVAQKKGLRITAMGEAKKNGRRGEMIKVVNLDSKKILFAKVVDGDTVRIEF